MLLDLVDVFGSAPLRGNPLAVVRGGGAFSTAQMQALTDWLGFSETTFLLPPDDPAADYRVRIFCPGRELPFAGHPTLGSCHAWLAAGGQPQQPGVIVQQCGVGLVTVRQDEERLAFAAPPLIRSGPLDAETRATAIAVAGVDPGDVLDAVHAANGPDWVLLRMASARAVLGAVPAARAATGTDVGLVAAVGDGDEAYGAAQFELRAFFADAQGTIIEDPVTGSLNAATAQVLFDAGLAQDSYVAAQGRKTGADGRVHCRRDEDGTVWIGGRCAMISQGGELKR